MFATGSRFKGTVSLTAGLAAVVLFLIFIALAIVSEREAMADDTLAKAQAALAALKADVESGRVVRADVFAVRYHILPITA